MSEVTIFKYAGSTPGTDSDTYVIFDTTVAFPGARMLAYAGIKRMCFDFEHSHLATLNWYRSNDRGVNWHQVGTEALAAPAANETNVRDFLVEGYDDWKLQWVNGGTAQSPFSVAMWGTDERGVAD